MFHGGVMMPELPGLASMIGPVIFAKVVALGQLIAGEKHNVPKFGHALGVNV